MLTCETKQQGQVGVLSVSPLSQDAAQGAQVTEAGGDLYMKPLCETSPSWLQGRGGLITAPLLWVAHLLLQGQILLNQFLVVGRQLKHSNQRFSLQDLHNISQSFSRLSVLPLS